MQDLIARFERLRPQVDFCSLRYVRNRRESLSVRRGVVEPLSSSEDQGLMVTVIDGGGYGYAATSDLSSDGVYHALGIAQRWAARSVGHCAFDPACLPRPAGRGNFSTPVRVAWDEVSIGDKLDRLRSLCDRLPIDPRITDYQVAVTRVDSEILLVSSEGAEIHQYIRRVLPLLWVNANEGIETQTRSVGSAHARQGGLEVLDEMLGGDIPERLAGEAVELLSAPNCPAGTLDLVLGPAQMALQIHESIGHPLELDRILGDERNYAGGSFVRPEDFGSFRYGSEHLNVVHDPFCEGEVAGFGFDDAGLESSREYVIESGVLVRGLGGELSQKRLGVPGVACARASSWNRPPIDRMANLNLEPGTSTLPELVASIERGVYMDDNDSWSIDDSRRKFQFGCEWGRLIEDGELTSLVKNPNYRGVTTEFWSSLDGVGDADTRRVLGTPNCGKGEPHQLNTAGHASPVCRFRGVEVFGGEH